MEKRTWTGDDVDYNTLFQFASITQQRSPSLQLMLRERGLLTFEDPVIRRVPEFCHVENPLGDHSTPTLRLLAQHTSGLQGEEPDQNPRMFTAVDARSNLDGSLQCGWSHER